MNLLGMFARYPEPGQTKTRLAAGIGNEKAADVYRCFVQDLLLRCGRLTDRFVVAATPDTATTAAWFYANGLTADAVWMQPESSLGERIAWFFEASAAAGAQRTVLIGSDSPDLPVELLHQAFLQLNNHDFVVAPADDGGFVLIGSAVPCGSVFQEVRWSSEVTLADTLHNIRSAGHTVSVLESWFDVDSVDDLMSLRDRLKVAPAGNPAGGCESDESNAGRATVSDNSCPQTLAMLTSLF